MALIHAAAPSAIFDNNQSNENLKNEAKWSSSEGSYSLQRTAAGFYIRSSQVAITYSEKQKTVC